MWDLASGKLLRSIIDAHPPGTAILHIKVIVLSCKLYICSIKKVMEIRLF